MSNENFMRMHEAIKKNELDIKTLQTHNKTIKNELEEQNEVLKGLTTYRELNEATLRFVIKESVSAAVEPLMQRITSLENNVSNLETEKYKTAYDTVKWIAIAGGSVVIAFVVGEIIKAVVN
ncbi:hypothetical protein ACVET5_001365 [Listeria monocytogenes]